MLPIVGITSDCHKRGDIFKGPAYFIGKNYVSAVRDSGGVPIILPYSRDKRMHEELLKRIDGLLITGGNFDVNPMFYGEKPIQKIGKFIDERTVFEMEMAKMALRRDMPVLGICGGEQLLNVARGGSLYQDIQTQVQ
ncbi:MAG: gamma-glutamyl-gamma-aminobutyrate hydrolase family protein, partial [Thermodesulfobacteriota bacterium]|nr:gamma-glutamyl-gamma-aminobutyrate hydrolase family protein [Thermodesulfobacteriota bacterium]